MWFKCQCTFRFSTWFFVAQADNQQVNVDGFEITDSLWVKPQEAIRKHHRQEIDMLPPTLVSLTALIQFNEVREVLNHYENREPLLFFPQVSFWSDLS